MSIYDIYMTDFRGYVILYSRDIALLRNFPGNFPIEITPYTVALDMKGCIATLQVVDTPFPIQGDELLGCQIYLSVLQSSVHNCVIPIGQFYPENYLICVLTVVIFSQSYFSQIQWKQERDLTTTAVHFHRTSLLGPACYVYCTNVLCPNVRKEGCRVGGGKWLTFLRNSLYEQVKYNAWCRQIK